MMKITGSSYLDIYNNVHSKTNISLEKIKVLLDEEDLTASDKLYDFLKEVEDIFRRNQIAAFTDIAGYRIELLDARIALDQRIPQKKYQLKKTSDLIPNVTQTVHEALRCIETRITTTRNLIRQFITTAQKEHLSELNKNMHSPTYLNRLWQLLLNHKHYKSKAQSALNSMSKADILLLLSEEINEFYSKKSLLN